MKTLLSFLLLLTAISFAGEDGDAFAKYEKAIIASGQFPLSSWLIVTSPSSNCHAVNVKDCLPDEAAKINKAAEEAHPGAGNGGTRKMLGGGRNYTCVEYLLICWI